jgi:hypothetical protein
MTFAYDGFGNLTQQGQTYLSINQNTNQIDSAGYQYNANGNVTQTPGPVSYSYDVANRLGPGRCSIPTTLTAPCIRRPTPWGSKRSTRTTPWPG